MVKPSANVGFWEFPVGREFQIERIEDKFLERVGSDMGFERRE